MAAFGQGPTPWSPSARAREWERGRAFSRPDGPPAQAQQDANRADDDGNRRHSASPEPSDDFVRRALHRRYQ